MDRRKPGTLPIGDSAAIGGPRKTLWSVKKTTFSKGWARPELGSRSNLKKSRGTERRVSGIDEKGTAVERPHYAKRRSGINAEGLTGEKGTSSLRLQMGADLRA